MDMARKPGQTMPEFTLALVFYGILKTSIAGRRLDLVFSYLCIFIFIYGNRYSVQTSGFSGYASLDVLQITCAIYAFIMNGKLF